MTCLRREWTVNDALLFCCFSHILNAHIFMHWGFLGGFFGVSIIPLPLFTLIFCFQLPLIKLHLHSFILDSWSHRYLRMLQGNCFKKEKEAAGLEKRRLWKPNTVWDSELHKRGFVPFHLQHPRLSVFSKYDQLLMGETSMKEAVRVHFSLCCTMRGKPYFGTKCKWVHAVRVEE